MVLFQPTHENVAYFLRQSVRAKKILLDVVAGVVWAEMTLLYRKDTFYQEVDDEDDEVEMEPFTLMGSKHVVDYIYKVLDTGIPPSPTYARYKAGLIIHGVPNMCLGLYTDFITDITTVDFGKLYEKLMRGYVDSDTGNYCSFHGPSIIPKPKAPRIPIPLAPNSSELFEETDEEDTNEGVAKIENENKENEITEETLAQAVASALGH